MILLRKNKNYKSPYKGIIMLDEFTMINGYDTISFIVKSMTRKSPNNQVDTYYFPFNATHTISSNKKWKMQ